jgi:hypothetical protein
MQIYLHCVDWTVYEREDALKAEVKRLDDEKKRVEDNFAKKMLAKQEKRISLSNSHSFPRPHDQS